MFLLLGRGQDLIPVIKELKRRSLVNIRFLDFLPRDENLQLLSVCDIGLVSLNEKLAVPNILSKTLSYFNLPIPDVVSIYRNTDYGQYLESANAGLCSYTGDTEKFRENLLKFYNSPVLKEHIGVTGTDKWFFVTFGDKYMITIKRSNNHLNIWKTDK